MKTFLQKIKLMIPAVTALVVPASAGAVAPGKVRGWGLDLLGTRNVTGEANTLAAILTIVINAFLSLAGIIAVIYFIWGGVIYLTAGGDAEKAGAGKTTIVHAIIGLIIIVAAFVIFRYVRFALLGTDQGQTLQ